jgi:hypothetical protein
MSDIPVPGRLVVMFCKSIRNIIVNFADRKEPPAPRFLFLPLYVSFFKSI